MAEQTTTSLQKYSTLVRLNPDDPEAHFGMAVAYEESGQQSYAFKEYQEVLRLNPRHARAHLNMGFSYCKGGEILPAIKEWQKAYELDPTVGRFLEDPKTRTYYDSKVEHALAMFERPVIMRGDDSYAHYQLAMAYRYFNKKEMALAELKKSVELNPNLWEAYNASGEIYAELGQLQFAKIQYQKAISVSPRHPDTFYNLGTIFEDEGMVGIAIQKYERALEIEPGNARLLFALGRAYLKQGRFKKAIVQFQKSIDKKPDDPYAHFHLAKSCEAIYRPDFAIREYELAVNIEPRYGEAHYNLGTLYINTGNLKQGVIHLEKALKLNPDDSYTYYNLGNAYDKLGEFQKAVYNYNQAIQLNPRDAFARYNLGQIYFKMEQFEDAIAEFEKALQINPNDSSFYLNLGKAYMELEDFDGAIEMFQKSVEHKPNDFESHYALARAFMVTDRLDLAISELTKVTDIKPSAPEPHFDLAQCLYTIGDVEQAFEQYQKVLIYDEKHLEAIQGVGQIYLYHRDKPDIAIDFFNQALEVDENFFPSILEKGNAYFKMGKLKAARREFERAAQINPDDIDLLAGLAEVYVQSERYDMAERELQKAINLDPENSKNRAAFARVLALLGKTEASVENYQKAIALDETNTDLYIRMSDQLLKLGDQHGAMSALTVLLDHDTGNERAQKALEVLFENPAIDLTDQTVATLSGIPYEEQVRPEVAAPVAAEAPGAAPAVAAAPGEESAKPKMQLKKKGLRSKIKSTGVTRSSEDEALSAPVISPQVLTTFTKAITAQAKGKDREAADLFQEVINSSPQYYQAYSPLGELLSKMDRVEESNNILQRGKSLAEKYKDSEYIEIFSKQLGILTAVVESPVPVPPPEAVKPSAPSVVSTPEKDKGLNPEDFPLFDMPSAKSGEIPEYEGSAIEEPVIEEPVLEEMDLRKEFADDRPVAIGVRDQGLPSWVVFDSEEKSEEISLDSSPVIGAYTSAPESVMGYKPPKAKLPGFKPRKEEPKPEPEKDDVRISNEIPDEIPKAEEQEAPETFDELAAAEEIASMSAEVPEEDLTFEAEPDEEEEEEADVPPSPPEEEEIQLQDSEPAEVEEEQEDEDEDEKETVESSIITDENEAEEETIDVRDEPVMAQPMADTEYLEPEVPEEFELKDIPTEPLPVSGTELLNKKSEGEPTEHLASDYRAGEVTPRPMPVPSIPRSSGFLSEDMTDGEILKRLDTITRFIRLRKFGQAEKELQKLSSAFPDHKDIVSTKAQLHKSREDWGPFVEEWRNFIKLSGERTRENLLILSDGMDKAGLALEALETVRELLEQSPEDMELMSTASELLIKTSDFAEAVSFLQKLVKLRPGVHRYLFNLARAYREMGKFSLATVQYQKVLRDVESPEIYNELGLTYEKIGKNRSAIGAYEKSQALDPENVTANLSLILLYEEEGKLDKAVETAQNTLDNCELDDDQEEILREKLQELKDKSSGEVSDTGTGTKEQVLQLIKGLEKEEARAATNFLILKEEQMQTISEEEEEEEDKPGDYQSSPAEPPTEILSGIPEEMESEEQEESSLTGQTEENEGEELPVRNLESKSKLGKRHRRKKKKAR